MIIEGSRSSLSAEKLERPPSRWVGAPWSLRRMPGWTALFCVGQKSCSVHASGWSDSESRTQPGAALLSMPYTWMWSGRAMG